jgi:hypothetical protein
MSSFRLRTPSPQPLYVQLITLSSQAGVHVFTAERVFRFCCSGSGACEGPPSSYRNRPIGGHL